MRDKLLGKFFGERVLQVDIEEEMKSSYLDYAMSVIVGRALPDVRDGLKPVHRRILYGMLEMGNLPDRPHKKAARIVGDVLGKFHPHGDMAVYDALVRLAQEFSSRYPLIDGHGNFGSIDGDEPAAMRYTEVRLSRLAMEMLADIDKNTVDFVPNFDGSLEEPTVLPSRLPNILVNGSSGIAVGMATNIPPHNLKEVVDALVFLVDNPEATVEQIMQIIPGPDFPTGGVIMGREGIIQAYTTGKGAVILRGVVNLEELKGGRQQLVISEVPYQVNKAQLVERIAELVRERKILGVSDIRDESDRRGIRVVLELKREARPNTIIKQMYKHTQLQISFGAIMLALVDGVPRVLNLLDLLREFLKHRETVITRRSRFELEKSRNRQHILQGLQIALDHIDEVVNLIRSSTTVEEAKGGLVERFGLSEVQAQAILDMRLSRLTGLERSKLDQELEEVTAYIAHLEALLADRSKIMQVVKEELLSLKEKYGDQRRTRIEGQAETFQEEDLIPEEKVVVSVTSDGYLKRIPMSSYRSQRRGGVGVYGTSLRREDAVEEVFVCSTHERVLFFTTKGKVYGVQAFEIPEGSRTDRGSSARVLLSLDEDENITTAIPIPKAGSEGGFLVLATEHGLVKRTSLKEFENAGKRGIRAINLREGDHLCQVKRTNHQEELVLFSARGYAVKFKSADLRPMGRSASGVRGMTLREGDRVAGMEVLRAGRSLLLVSEYGFGKLVSYSDLPLRKRGGKGVIVFRSKPKTGPLVCGRSVAQKDDVILVTANGKVIRINVKEIPHRRRMATGVHLVKVESPDKVVALARISEEKLEGFAENSPLFTP
ncbi:MAG: DNA gyrase subunit A [Caldiserica bacterium]|nr:DNA gyrase subunit A [Caldisericota bacterium]